MRRGSLFAPLLLIGLGALFLARNIYPDLRLLDYLAKFWPLILIMWGALRIVEILFWAGSKRPLPARGVSAGEWMLVLILCFFGFTLHAVRGFSGWFPGTIEPFGLDIFGESYDYPVSAEKPSGKAPRIVIENLRGNVRVAGIDTSSVKVNGHKNIRSIDQEGSDRADRETPLELKEEGGAIYVRTNQNHTLGPRRVSEDLEITVPKGASIEAHGRYGDYDIRDLDGSVDITSDHAEVEMDNVGGAAHLNLTLSPIIRAVKVKGSLDVKGAGSDLNLEGISGNVTVNGRYTGNLEFHDLGGSLHLTGPQTDFSVERVPGDVRMSLRNLNASNVVGPIRVQTRSRDVQISDFTNSLDVLVDNGDIDLRPSLPLARMDVHTRSGNLTLALPKDAKFALTASTGVGSILNQFGGPLSLEESHRNATLRGSNGGPAVTVRTERGEVTVREASPNEPPFGPHVEQMPTTLPRELNGYKDFSKKIEQ